MAEADFDSRRAEVFAALAAGAEKRVAALTPALALDLRTVAPAAAREAADRVSWSLIAAALHHLENGAPGGGPGTMAGALSRVSLRSSPLAAALGILPPRFEQTVRGVTHGNGRDEALFTARRLIEAAEGDIQKSRQIIHREILSAQPGAAFGALPDPTLADIFRGVQPENIALLPGLVTEEDGTAFRKQMILSFNTLLQAYAGACRDFRADLDNFPPPPAAKARGPYLL